MLYCDLCKERVHKLSFKDHYREIHSLQAILQSKNNSTILADTSSSSTVQTRRHFRKPNSKEYYTRKDESFRNKKGFSGSLL
jgi:hypothetical protein